MKNFLLTLFLAVLILGCGATKAQSLLTKETDFEVKVAKGNTYSVPDQRVWIIKNVILHKDSTYIELRIDNEKVIRLNVNESYLTFVGKKFTVLNGNGIIKGHQLKINSRDVLLLQKK